MQDTRTIVPNFGSWETDTDIPYTTVFEKVRTAKDGKLSSLDIIDKPCQLSSSHHLQDNQCLTYPAYEIDIGSHMSSELHCTGQKSVLGESAFQTKNVVDGQSYSSRRSSLEQMADHIFAESQHAAGNDSPVISRHSASSNALRRGNQHMDREFAEHCIKENSCKRLVPCYLQGSQKQGHHSHENRVSSSAVSIRKDDYHPSDSNRQHESISTPKVRRAQQLLQSSYPNTDMVPERTLPKFGDWDAMDPTRVEFTVIFDKARNERKFSMNQERPITKEARAQGNEDLYESSSTRRRNVLWTLVCCSPVSLGGR